MVEKIGSSESFDVCYREKIFASFYLAFISLLCMTVIIATTSSLLGYEIMFYLSIAAGVILPCASVIINGLVIESGCAEIILFHDNTLGMIFLLYMVISCSVFTCAIVAIVYGLIANSISIVFWGMLLMYLYIILTTLYYYCAMFTLMGMNHYQIFEKAAKYYVAGVAALMLLCVIVFITIGSQHFIDINYDQGYLIESVLGTIISGCCFVASAVITIVHHKKKTNIIQSV